jgi:muramoyltetrapeptide carboxypeptidase
MVPVKTEQATMAIVKPRALRPGDTIGVIDRATLEAGCARLNQLGYATTWFESIFERDQYFAGSTLRRVAELKQMFLRPEINAIFCARGGYGCNYLLPHMDAAALRKHPKIFMGFSDITTLLTWIVDRGMVAIHGPMVTRGFADDSADLDSFRAVLGGSALNLSFGADSGVSVLRDGSAGGVLYGGCLSLLAESLGTAYEVQPRNKLLFLEDVNVHAYQVDRMLMHLRLAGKLDSVRGFIFGQFAGCDEPGGEYTLRDAILRALEGLNVPIVVGLPSGHVDSGNLTLPMGVPARLVAAGSVTLNCDSAADA